MKVDLEEYRKKGLEQGNNEIQKIKAKLPQGVSLDLKLTDIRFDRFNYDAENLYLAFMAAGDCSAAVKNLDFSIGYPKGHMKPGKVLNPGQSIVSVNGRFRFIYQGDGN